MKCVLRTMVLGGLMVGLSGCGSSSTANKLPLPADAKTPDLAVKTFLEAVRKGDHEKATLMLTPTARIETAKHELSVAPPGSATAKFTVGQVEYVTPEKDGAHVASTWTDFDLEGKPNADNIVWVLRMEDEGWRIAGMAVKIFEGELPLILNFEDPEDMIRKQKLAAEEMARRSSPAANNQIAQPMNSPGEGIR